MTKGEKLAEEWPYTGGIPKKEAVKELIHTVAERSREEDCNQIDGELPVHPRLRTDLKYAIRAHKWEQEQADD